MLLRSGTVYKSQSHTRVVKCKNDHHCAICLNPYIKNDRVTTCDKNNHYRHSFHVSCIDSLKYFTAPNSIYKCPYCRICLKHPFGKWVRTIL